MQSAAQAIVKRGTRLNPPADEEKLSYLRAIDLGSHKSSIMQMFSLFNGFAEWEATNATDIWTVQRFLLENRLAIETPNQVPFAIGDVMLDSDLIELADEGGRLFVKLRFEGTRIADSIADLLARIGAGTLGT